MKHSMTGLAGVAMTALLALTSVAPAQAQTITFGYGERDRVIRTYCDRNPRDRDCRGYYGGNWSQNDYNRFYGRHRSGLDNIASGLFGFTFGAILGSAIANSGGGTYRSDRAYRAHVEACYDRYRSYDERTDTFLGYDGVRHRCRL